MCGGMINRDIAFNHFYLEKLLLFKRVFILSYIKNTECEMLLSTVMRIVENEQNAWRQALALEVMFKVISQPDSLR